MRGRLTCRPPRLLARGARPEATSLEQVAAEFALLAQRRARVARQINSLSGQIHAAERAHAAVEQRMQSLARRMLMAEAPQAITPAPPPPPSSPPPSLPPPSPPPTPVFAPRTLRLAASRRRYP